MHYQDNKNVEIDIYSSENSVQGIKKSNNNNC